VSDNCSEARTSIAFFQRPTHLECLIEPGKTTHVSQALQHSHAILAPVLYSEASVERLYPSSFASLHLHRVAV
jgi:hypothetical protein